MKKIVILISLCLIFVTVEIFGEAEPAKPAIPSTQSVPEISDKELKPKFVKKHPEIAERIACHPKLELYLEKHPGLGEAIVIHPRAAEFIAKHPNASIFLSKHPKLYGYLLRHKHCAKILHDRGLHKGWEKGVRDHGKGEGRSGIGQGNEHRKPETGPKKSKK
ncbi:MAG: hypothetical protein AUJ85_04890 [Elusimicrobia bacterium CG1_02_37_114]|nr:MAG: hypothetical protein AUJ85_04890 [Elusimicrobia bacterium CG1_02_37_114]PIV53426.1 MAG: hypothetical protein COS17_03940 [Elusimicrobia bacterium CG02_land_8_20_14_3_00_37_13]PIZ13832.1 MAG: hypothetical protein COY53_02780 [Elusimicrobia bacterium CG_4_10_14_0_8_um_filter_37_32]